MADNRVSYLNKTFSDFKKNLENYAKTYFPTTYNDFSDTNPGAMFIELASYVGDVSSFYADTQLQETFLLYAKEKENLYSLSYTLGYRPKVSYASVAIVDVYQLIPTVNIGGITQPNYDYAVIVPENTSLSSTGTGGIKFLTTEKVDFTDTNNTEITLTTGGDYYLLKKQTKAISAEIKSTTITPIVGQKFQTFTISDTNILQIIDAIDTEGNNWYEVPYLAQSTTVQSTPNSNYQSDGVPYLMNYKKVSRRYVSRFLSDNTLQLEFGAGVADSTDNIILPNPNTIPLGLIPGINDTLNSFNKATPFFTQEYGLSPSSNITVRYTVGGGIASNVASNTITTISTTNVYFPSSVNDNMASYIISNIAVNNPAPSAGGRNGDQVEELRNNALYAYQSQLRAVTREDYMVRALSLPTDYGSIAKVYVTQDIASEMLPTPTVATTEERNPLSLDMYILAYDTDKKLTIAATTLKQNLATYLNQYRMVTDAINIKDAFYINIGVNFDIVVASGYNNNDVLTSCITSLKNHFNIERWNVNQPIVISDISSALLQTKGVQSVTKIEIVNKQGGNYSSYAYDIIAATKQNNVYPSLDPSIFEVRYPDTDIQGRVVPFSI